MKRKRGQRGGHKKLKIKQTTENNSNNDNNEISSESEPEPVIKPDKKIQPESKPEPISVPISKPQTQAVYSRVRVKIKSPISVPISNSSPISAPISNSPSIPAPISNSSPISVPIAAPISEKTNLGANTAPKLINTFSRKFGGIKIKTNKSMTPGGGTETSMDKEVSVPVQVPVPVPVPVPVQVSESNYDEAELNAALGVIKKIMKMEAAAPFNEPVDPVALGIPDYFDVIETPMDFGTICKEIEKGRKCKYQNSQDVYKDVQLIWQNCYKYNNKGDYVIDLMRRVKKNFSKYWGAAGLSTSNHEGSQNEEGSNEKNQRGKLKQQQKKKKRSTMDHKIDCLCAVCVIRRRKSEKDSDSPTINLEEKSPGTSSPIGTDQSMDYNNNTEEKKKKEIKIKSQNSNFGKDEIAVCTNNQAASQVLSSESDESEENNENENDDEENNNIINDNNNASSQPEDKGNKIEALKKNEILVENHSVLELCKSVFDDRSRWTGSTALVRRGPGSVRDNNNNPFHSAIASLLKL